MPQVVRMLFEIIKDSVKRMSKEEISDLLKYIGLAKTPDKMELQRNPQ